MKRMIRMGVMLGVVLAVSTAMGDGKKAAAADMESSSETSFTGVAMLVKTNAQGAVSEAAFNTTSSTYGLLTNGVAPAVLKEWGKFNDRMVDVKGEVTQANGKLCIKVTGIKDVTPSLRGGSLGVTLNEKKAITQISFTVPDRRITYTVSTNGMTDAMIKGLLKLNGTVVDIDGKISQSRGLITDVRSIRPGKAVEKAKKETPPKKRGR